MNLDYSIIFDKYDIFLKGALVTLEISIISLILGTILGIVFALFRISSNPILSGLAGVYVWIVRGTPLLVQLFILYFGLPQIGIKLSPMVSGIVGLSVNTGAYIAEIIRSGIQAIDHGQMEAAQSLGMSYPKAMIRIIGPQVAKICVPSLVNQFIMSLKNSSMASLVTISELFRAGEQLIATTFRSFEVYTTVAVLYLAMNSVFMVIANMLEKRMGKI
ncbi:cystine transporter permease [Clostridium polyendosporum]|uniref:Cystine transporter permease n=1 Tax=Clostridium polyendosporum TaxID=69208 RepID=A0A919S4B1_9CLOT|nr:amino acid ABC transporter permease [Clostridium polyendosporum]GIM30353.1 cystine transporter permease [Clostridium polyendosporum]